MHPSLKVRLNFCFVKSRMVKKNIGDSRRPSLREAVHLIRHVSAQLPLAGKKNPLKEMKEEKISMSQFSLFACPGYTCHKLSVIKIKRPFRCIYVHRR